MVPKEPDPGEIAGIEEATKAAEHAAEAHPFRTGLIVGGLVTIAGVWKVLGATTASNVDFPGRVKHSDESGEDGDLGEVPRPQRIGLDRSSTWNPYDSLVRGYGTRSVFEPAAVGGRRSSCG